MSHHTHRVHLPHRRPTAREQADAHLLKRAQEDHRGRLRNALIDLAIVVLLIIGASQLGSQLSGVGAALNNTDPGPLVAAVGLEIVSELGFVLAFLLVMDPDRHLFSKRGVGQQIAWAGEAGCSYPPARRADRPLRRGRFTGSAWRER